MQFLIPLLFFLVQLSSFIALSRILTRSPAPFPLNPFCSFRMDVSKVLQGRIWFRTLGTWLVLDVKFVECFYFQRSFVGYFCLISRTIWLLKNIFFFFPPVNFCSKVDKTIFFILILVMFCPIIPIPISPPPPLCKSPRFVDLSLGYKLLKEVKNDIVLYILSITLTLSGVHWELSHYILVSWVSCTNSFDFPKSFKPNLTKFLFLLVLYFYK